MADRKGYTNPANAMFGLNDPKVDEAERTRPRPAPAAPASGSRPAGAAPQGSQSGFPFGATVSFGIAQPNAASGEPPNPPVQEPLMASMPPQAGPAASPGAGQAPQYVYVQQPPMAAPPRGRGLFWAVIALAVFLAANIGFAYYTWQQLTRISQTQTDQLNLLTRRMDSSDERYAQLRGQFDVTAEKLGLTQQELSRAKSYAANIERQQKQAVHQLNAAIAQKASATQVNSLQQEANAKFGSLSGDIAGTQKDLNATKEALTGAKGELSGAIAKTHDELVALAHRTDRDYFEFHLNNKGARQKVGSMTVQLVKTNTKKNLFSAYLFFDDKKTYRGNASIDQPVFFYMEGAPSALELVVNKLAKNSISGYVSAPKGFFQNTPNVLSARPTS
jgi:predicted outer membrane protein